MIATRKIREQQAAQDRQVEGQQRTLYLATLRYEKRLLQYLEVLDAQRSLFNAELQQVQLQRARLGALVNFYKALGGGVGAVNCKRRDHVFVTGEMPCS